MKAFMRLNRYNHTPTDPLFPTPEAAIAARGDLMPDAPRLAGAYDGKITSHALLTKGGLAATAIAGPTSVDQPVFEWTGRWANMSAYPHWGHPPRFDFEWQVFRGR